ncbi:hypothetical protein [Agrobacterium sp. Azo12]|uniref:hypothetical protein n=1 Tax=Agrobacterium sp. Azo12 TaxID=3031129 RepID=UPI0023D820BA|nr:hypothetical protein [Agrobacterium sp. Azo12]MDO5895104.1 hypothetical protein [Agrobacterium sp. Azo12]
MERFDRLPAQVRSAINFAGFEFAVRFAERLLGRGASPDVAAKIIRETDLRLTMKRQGGAA